MPIETGPDELPAFFGLEKVLPDWKATKRRFVMPPVIDYEKCTGCGTCDALCPADAIYMRESEKHLMPYMKYPEECWHCGSCRQDCPEEAITIVFPPDMLSI